MIMEVQGDSMTPTLNEGDVILVDINQRNSIPPGVFVLHDGMALVPCVTGFDWVEIF